MADHGCGVAKAAGAGDVNQAIVRDWIDQAMDQRRHVKPLSEVRCWMDRTVVLGTEVLRLQRLRRQQPTPPGRRARRSPTARRAHNE